MALVAWYKLDGNALDSSGYGNNGTASNMSWGSGKIGQCGVFNGSNSLITTSSLDLQGDISLSAWFYSLGRAGTQGIVSNHQHSQTANFTMSINSSNVIYVHMGYTDGTRSAGIESQTTLELNKWYHAVFTYSHADKKCRLYIDGNLDNEVVLTKTVKFLPSTFVIGRWAPSYGDYYFNGNIDDVRIYDHALSPKEVKELAKAKILHYRMDDFQEPTINLMPATCDYGDFENDARTSIGVYNNGSSSGVVVTHSIVSAVAEGIPKPPNGSDKVLKITVDNTVGYTGNVGWYLMTNSTHGTTCLANKQYTQSAWMLMPKEITAQGFTNNSGITNNTIIRPDPDGSSWKHYSRTFTVGTSNYTGGLHYYAKMPGQVYSFYMDMHQLEEKPYATEYAKGERLGTVYDSSGYDNHAELALATTPRWVGSESSKIGSGAYEFNGSNTITTGRLFHDNVNQCHTVSAWVYPTNPSAIGNQQLVNFNLGYRIYHTAGGQSLMYVNSGTNDHYVYGPVIPAGQWTLVTWVYDKATLTCRVYYNGVLSRSSGNFDTSDVPSGFSSETIFGSNFYGLIDDVRIYATALSDEDIKELYQTRAALDSHGNLWVT